MRRFDYLHFDVFTSRQFEGNQLAVFLDGHALDAREMQTIAREMNFSESTFVLPAERPDTDVRMRIFTPGVELPMAGHPTIGSTFALAHSGVIRPGRETFVFGLGVGPTRVELKWQGEQLDRKSTRLNSSHGYISYAVFCLKKKKKNNSSISR